MASLRKLERHVGLAPEGGLTLRAVQVQGPSFTVLAGARTQPTCHPDLKFPWPAPKVVRGSGGTKDACLKDPSASHSGQVAWRKQSSGLPTGCPGKGPDLRGRLGRAGLACHSGPGCPLVAALG